MAKLWTQGGVDLQVDTEKGTIKLLRGDTYELDEAEVILDDMLFECKRCKLAINRYAVYVPSVKLADDAKTISATVVAGAFKKHESVVLMANKFGQPFLLIAEPKANKPAAKQSTTRKVVRRK